MEADSRLNNDAMKGEGTLRVTQMPAVRCVYMHHHWENMVILHKKHQNLYYKYECICVFIYIVPRERQINLCF